MVMIFYSVLINIKTKNEDFQMSQTLKFCATKNMTGQNSFYCAAGNSNKTRKQKLSLPKLAF